MRNPFMRALAISAGAAVGVVIVVALAFIAMGTFGGNNGSKSVNAQEAPVCPADQPVPDPRITKDKATPVHVEPGCIVKGDVEVSDSQGGTYASAHLSDSQGNLLYCPEGCWIRADYGANITNRPVTELVPEMMSKDCDGGCKVVHGWVFVGGKLTQIPDADVLKLVTILSGDPSKAPTPGASPSATPTTTTKTTAPVNCDPSIEKGKSMLVPKNCVVEGDVAVGTAENGPWTKLYDNDQATGLVVVTKADVWVKAPYGASASGVSVSDAVSDVFDLGCGLEKGCYAGVDTVTVDVSNGQLVITHSGMKKPK